MGKKTVITTGELFVLLAIAGVIFSAGVTAGYLLHGEKYPEVSMKDLRGAAKYQGMKMLGVGK